VTCEATVAELRVVATHPGAGLVAVRRRTSQRSRLDRAWRHVDPTRVGDKCSTHLVHKDGWELHHCGHPTAIYGYYLVDPSGRQVLAANGRGWMTQAAAMEHVRGVGQ